MYSSTIINNYKVQQPYEGLAPFGPLHKDSCDFFTGAAFGNLQWGHFGPILLHKAFQALVAPRGQNQLEGLCEVEF